MHGTAMPRSGRTRAGGLLSVRGERLRPLVQWLARHRWPVLVAAALLEGVAARAEPTDLAMFAQIGRQLLSGDLSAVYAGDYNQSGPVQLVLAVLALPFGATGAGLLVLHAVGNGWCLDVRSRWPEVVSIAALIYLPFLSYGALALPSVVLSLARPGLRWWLP